MSAMRRASVPAVKLKPDTHAKLQDLAKSEDRPMGEIITELVDRYERDKFWKDLNSSVEALRSDPVAWKDYQDEVRFFERGMVNRLTEEEPYFTAEEEEALRAEHARTRGR